MAEKTTLKERLQSYYNPKMIPRYHESCRNHELRQSMNYEKSEDKCPYEIHIKCLKGHDLLKTSANRCEDYEVTDENFMWKISIMEQIVKESNK